MREEFHAELAEVSGLLVAMADEVRSAMKRATTALLTAGSSVSRMTATRWDEGISAVVRRRSMTGRSTAGSGASRRRRSRITQVLLSGSKRCLR